MEVKEKNDEACNNEKKLVKEQIKENEIYTFSEIFDELNIILKKLENKKIDELKKNENSILLSLNKIIDLLSKIDDENNINNINDLNLNDLTELMNKIQTIYHSNVEIVKKVENIYNLLINISNNGQMLSLLDIIIKKLDDKNTDQLFISLKLMHDILKKNSYLIEPIYDITLPKIEEILYKNKNLIIQIFCYKIMILFIYNEVFSFDLVSKGLLIKIKEVLHKIRENNKNSKETINKNCDEEDLNIHINDININNYKKINDKIDNDDLQKQIYILLGKLANVNSNVIKMCEEFMKKILNEINDPSIKQNIIYPLNFLKILIEKDQKCLDSFVNLNGIEWLFQLLKNNEKNSRIILKIFQIIFSIVNYKIYNDKLIRLKLIQFVKDLIEKYKDTEKEIEFRGKSILFQINFDNKKLEEIEDYDMNQIDLNKKSIPPAYVTNFLSNGKIVSVVNDLGEIKKKYLLFSPDFLKIIAKDVKGNVPTKQKYIINTKNIKSVIKGYGTDAFKKCKRLFRSTPESEKCFSIIAFEPSEGEYSINVICEKESEANKWVKYIKDIIIYLQENKIIQRNIDFRDSLTKDLNS